MSTDIEHELRELFRDKAGEAPVTTPHVAAAAPQQVLRRARLHQVGTVVGSAAVIFVLVVGSVAGLGSLLRGRDTVGGPGDYEVFERTATIEAFTATSPSDWYLVNHWPTSMRTSFAALALCPEETPTTNSDCVASPDPLELDPALGLPMFQLTNEDIGLGSAACGEALEPQMAVLYIALDYASDIAGTYPPYLSSPSEREVPAEGDGPCGPGRYALFTVNGEPFFAWVGVGEGASDSDRRVVLDAFQSMTIDDTWEPAEPDHTTPAYVIAGGVVHDEPWRLEVRPSERNIEMTLMGAVPWGAQPDFAVPETPIEWCCMGDGLIEVTFGAVSKDATGVEVRPSDGSPPILGTIVPLPPSLPFAFDLFFVDGTEGLAGDVIALGLDDTPPPQVAEPRASIVELTGSFEGQDWSVRFTGATADKTACVRAAIGTEPLPAFCPEPPEEPFPGDHPTMHDWLTSDLYLHAGSVPLEVVELRFSSDDGTIVPSQFRCQMGPLGWTEPDVRVCVIVLPPAGSGTLEFLDAEGNAISEAGLAWGSATATGRRPIPVDPVRGGTYWAVYAWVGSGAEEDEIEAAQRYLEDRGVHGLRGSLACDQGAAKVLGTSAEHKVAVYFQTQEEANAFALEAGLLGHEAGPIVAQVTIVCLE
jgi:hypothetical protein